MPACPFSKTIETMRSRYRPMASSTGATGRASVMPRAPAFTRPSSSLGELAAGERVFLELGEVHDVALVRINEEYAGRSLVAPRRVDITEQARTGGEPCPDRGRPGFAEQPDRPGDGGRPRGGGLQGQGGRSCSSRPSGPRRNIGREPSRSLGTRRAIADPSP